MIYRDSGEGELILGGELVLKLIEYDYALADPLPNCLLR